MKRRIVSLFEGIVNLAIVLVLFQTLIEDVAILSEWSWEIRRNLLVAGFLFDLFFTVEFLARFYLALSRGEAGAYFFRRRGWVDFAASVPLLLFSSGPMMLAIFAGPSISVAFAGTLNLLKVVKAVRVARVLRLLRLLKLFRRIRYEQAQMAQRHITKIITIALTVVILSGIGFELLFDLLEIRGVERVLAERFETFERQFTASVTGGELRGESPVTGAESGAEGREPLSLSARSEDTEGAGGKDREGEPAAAGGPGGINLLPEGLAPLLALEHNVLIIREGERTLYSRYGNEYYAREFGPSDYLVGEEWRFTFFYDIRLLAREQARTTLLMFSAIMALVLAFLLYYSPHFAVTVTDPIHIMRRGMKEGSYDLKVMIPRRYRGDELFQLAEAYNEDFLPLKDRTRGEEGTALLDLRMDDLKDLLKEGM